MELIDQTDEALVQLRSSPVSADAFGVFYGRYERPVAAYHLRRVGYTELVPDLTAETFLQALEARGRFRSQGDGSAARWLFAIAHNVLARSARRATSEAQKQAAVAQVQRVLTAVQREELLDLETDIGALRALEHLPDLQRQAVREYVLHGRSYEELAASTGASEATVRQRVSRGLTGLRRHLKGES